MLLSFLVLISCLLRAHGADGRKLSDLNSNKHIIRTIHTEHGDIYDCYDIHKQPAFDHPLLKNHKLEVGPNSLARKKRVEGAAADTKVQIGLKDGCPEGSVPILRPRKGHDHERSSPKNSSRVSPLGAHPWYPEYPDVHIAVQNTVEGVFYGGSGLISVWGPHCEGQQYSDMKITVVGIDNAIQAGWRVDPHLYGDNLTRLFGRWTVDLFQKTGCFDLRCSGFVQISGNIPLGFPLQPLSAYEGQQCQIELRLFKSKAFRHWWLAWHHAAGDVDAIGYWPDELFISLKEHANHVVWGAETYKGPGHTPWPTMGSGHEPILGFTRAAYIGKLSVSDENNNFIPVVDYGTKIFPRVNAKDCAGVYPAIDLPDPAGGRSLGMYVGGTGGFC